MGQLGKEGPLTQGSVLSEPTGPGRGLACQSAPEEPTQTSPGLSSCLSKSAELPREGALGWDLPWVCTRLPAAICARP